MNKMMIICSIVIIISAYSAKLSKRFNIPLLIIFIFIGMLLGSDGIGNIYFNDPNFAYFIATIALCFILFYGGFQTKIQDVKPIIKEGIALSVIGVILNAVIFAFPIYYFTNLNWLESFLASSAVASTDAAAVFSLLEFSKIKLKHRLRNVLEFESGSNDPIAYVMVLMFITMINEGPHGSSTIYYVIFFIRQMLIGAAMGFFLGYISKFILERLKLKIEELYSIIIIGILFFTFSATNLLYGNGFLAIYILGIMLRSKKFLYKNSTLKFFSVISWLMQIALFICLGLLVFPSELIDFAYYGIPLALILVFIVRPICVFSTLAIFKKKYNTKSKLYLSWGGLKGAVPIVFAIFTMVAEVPQSNTIFNLIFFIVLVSVLIQGTTLSLGSKLLGLNEEKSDLIKEKSDTEELEYFEDQMLELNITENSYFAGKQISEINFPEEALITLIKRNNSYVHPKGKTEIKVDDQLVIMCKNKVDFFNFIDELQST
ncbi:MAG: potassium/proton antiporter [bacterium]|nr:potassium/proton antiporter [bacterium]